MKANRLRGNSVRLAGSVQHAHRAFLNGVARFQKKRLGQSPRKDLAAHAAPRYNIKSGDVLVFAEYHATASLCTYSTAAQLAGLTTDNRTA